MQRHARSLLSLYPLVVLALSAAGCQCHKGGGVGDSFAEIDVLWVDGDGVMHSDRNATYDFGAAFVGDRIAKPMTIRNGGLSTLKLDSLVQVSGQDVTIGTDVKDDAYFEVQFTPPISIDPSADVTVNMFFTPRVGVKNPTAVLTLTGEGTRPEDNTATITLKGQGQGGLCDLPDVLDFGEVPLGDHFQLGWTFMNPASLAATATVGMVTGADAMSFVQDATGDLPLPAMGSAAVNFTFSPTELRAYTATVKMKGPGDCPEGDVLLKGSGANSVLTWTPNSIDYGYVSLNVSAPQDVVFTNMSNVPIQLTNIVSSMPTDFQYIAPMGETPTTLTLAGSGETHLTIACRPSSLGPRSATLTFDTPLAMVPHGSIDLKCVGGGPEIQVTPRPTLNFGQVAYFPNNSTYNVSRKVTVENIGTKPLNGDVNGNLFLGIVDPVNGPGQFPLVELTPAAGTDPSEFQVGIPSSYNPTQGLVASVGQNIADLLITLTPLSVGMKQATLTIHSNDPVAPTITVNITADVEALPPCNLGVAPTSLNFGLITPPDHKDLGVTLTNLGQNATDTCYISGIELAQGSDPAFTIVGGNVDMKEMQPGEVYTVVVRAWPMGAVPTNTQTLTGAMHFNVASPTTPQVVVPLQASIGPVCLTIVPDSWDFGTVKKDCNTAPQQFTIYNTCSGDVYISSITMQAGAGEPAGGPSCPGGAACPEFFLTSTPNIPAGGLKLATAGTTQFSAKYHPIDYGPDSGAISISAIQSGQNVTYLVSLAGLGDMTGQQTDTFVQDLSPKADVLVVVDDSCSMGDKQAALASNFTSFIQYAVSTNTDFQLGVTTTDAAPADCSLGFCVPGGVVNGRLCGGANCGVGNANNPIILTPTTANLQQKFVDKVNVGTNGGTETGFEGAMQALTPPNITGENAGFLRYDANLAIVVVSDAGDQGGQPYSYYLNRFRNIKGYQRANMFTFSDIGPYLPAPPNGCQYDDYTDSATYGQMVMDTNGVKAEICTSNWAANLQNLGKTAFGYRTTFFLSADPDLTGGKMIVVQIDGMPVPAANWTYNATTLSIDFDPMHTPGPGQTLTVTYFRACL